MPEPTLVGLIGWYEAARHSFRRCDRSNKTPELARSLAAARDAFKAAERALWSSLGDERATHDGWEYSAAYDEADGIYIRCVRVPRDAAEIDAERGAK